MIQKRSLSLCFAALLTGALAQADPEQQTSQDSEPSRLRATPVQGQAISNDDIVAQSPSVSAQNRKPVTPNHPLLEGAYYPDPLPVDRDNDLLFVRTSNDEPAKGKITHLTGSIRTIDGKPVRNAIVEIWQADSTGSYLPGKGNPSAGRDQNFQGYGKTVTGVDGSFYFRTIRPSSYTRNGVRRAPHINVVASLNGVRIFTSQMLIEGHPANREDGFYKQIPTQQERDLVVVPFRPIPGSFVGELSARFDIILGEKHSLISVGEVTNQIGETSFGVKPRQTESIR